jgi:hypothetical protein
VHRDRRPCTTLGNSVIVSIYLAFFCTTGLWSRAACASTLLCIGPNVRNLQAVITPVRRSCSTETGARCCTPPARLLCRVVPASNRQRVSPAAGENVRTFALDVALPGCMCRDALRALWLRPRRRPESCAVRPRITVSVVMLLTVWRPSLAAPRRKVSWGDMVALPAQSCCCALWITQLRDCLPFRPLLCSSLLNLQVTSHSCAHGHTVTDMDIQISSRLMKRQCIYDQSPCARQSPRAASYQSCPSSCTATVAPGYRNHRRGGTTAACMHQGGLTAEVPLD